MKEKKKKEKGRRSERSMLNSTTSPTQRQFTYAQRLQVQDLNIYFISFSPKEAADGTKRVTDCQRRRIQNQPTPTQQSRGLQPFTVTCIGPHTLFAQFLCPPHRFSLFPTTFAFGIQINNIAFTLQSPQRRPCCYYLQVFDEDTRRDCGV